MSDVKVHLVKLVSVTCFQGHSCSTNLMGDLWALCCLRGLGKEQEGCGEDEKDGNNKPLKVRHTHRHQLQRALVKYGFGGCKGQMLAKGARSDASLSSFALVAL